MKTIAGVPESITRQQVLTAAEALGLDTKVVRSITLGTRYVEVVVYTNHPLKLKDHDTAATHTVCYEIALDEPTADV